MVELAGLLAAFLLKALLWETSLLVHRTCLGNRPCGCIGLSVRYIVFSANASAASARGSRHTTVTQQRMKHIFVIGTGGTIAGVGDASGQRYRSGQLDVATLLASAKGSSEAVRLETHQLANIGSQDMSEALWFELAALTASQLAAADCAGVVIIHGTDTLEETAFFLECVLPASAKPVVLTGSMLPATATEPDGPANLASAILVAASAASAGRGVLVVFADCVFTAQSVFKQHTRALAAFSGGEAGAVGQVAGGAVRFFTSAACNGQAIGNAPIETETTSTPLGGALTTVDGAKATGTETLEDQWKAVPKLPLFDLATLAAAQPLPQVAVVTAYVGEAPEQIAGLVQLGCRGIIYAGFGNGTFSTAILRALEAAQQRGIVVVRSSRVPQGGVSSCGEVDDAAHGFIAAGTLNPQKARILLSLALARGDRPEQIRSLFAAYAPLAVT